MTNFLVIGLNNLYVLDCSLYPIKIHFSLLSSSFFLSSYGIWAKEIQLKTWKCETSTPFPIQSYWGTLPWTLDIGDLFSM